MYFIAFTNISCLLDNCLYGFGGCGLFVLVCGDWVTVETIHNFCELYLLYCFNLLKYYFVLCVINII